VARETGLDFESAKLASEREFSEPLIWQDDLSKQKEFCRVIEKLGLMTLEGGRFLHVLGATDKGRALEVLRKEYRPECVIALGDSQNDVAMLERADIGVVIASEKAVPLEVLHAKRLIWSKERGPNGWVEVMNDLLAELLETI
jgi:predicted mannosyl-3-phosphoglycerate phosphatase (HAD superfamily)